MNHIQPITSPMNYGEILNWELVIAGSRKQYEDFIKLKKERGMSQEKADIMWQNNFGVIPIEEPTRFYQCYIIARDLKLVVTVKQNLDIHSEERKYQVVKLNKIYIESYDYIRTMTKNDDGEIIFNKEYIELNEDITTDNINYEDSNWFSLLHFKSILNRLKIKVLAYDGDNFEPALYFNSTDSFEGTQFEFTDKEFEEKLYDKVNEAFLRVENILK